jgi:hypothetical protein
MDAQVMINGIWQVDPATGQQAQLRTGLQQLLRELSNRFAPLEQEAQLQAVSEFMLFHRSNAEQVDDTVTRFEISRYRAAQVGGVAMNEVVLSWLLLTHLHIPLSSWPILLSSTNGKLPEDVPQYQAFIQYVRRNGHLYDKGGGHERTIRQPYYVEPTETQEAFYVDPYAHAQQTNAYWETQVPWSWNGDAFNNVYLNDASMPNTNEFEEAISDSSSDSDATTFAAADLSDVVYLSVQEAGENLYLAYKHAKSRWRTFQGQAARTGHRTRRFGRHVKSKGKGKGGKSKGKRFGNHKGKGPPAFWASDEASYDFEQQQAYAFQKGGKNGGRKMNPTGPDGKRMLCSICSSDCAASSLAS